MCLLLDRESWKSLLPKMRPFDVKTAMALVAVMGQDMHLSIRMGDLERLTGATGLSLRASIRRLETQGVVLVRKRGRGPGATINLVVSPALACDPKILPGFETGFDQLQNVCWIAFSLARRSKENP